jgi:hypothetical protein
LFRARAETDPLPANEQRGSWNREIREKVFSPFAWFAYFAVHKIQNALLPAGYFFHASMKSFAAKGLFPHKNRVATTSRRSKAHYGSLSQRKHDQGWRVDMEHHASVCFRVSDEVRGVRRKDPASFSKL